MSIQPIVQFACASCKRTAEILIQILSFKIQIWPFIVSLGVVSVNYLKGCCLAVTVSQHNEPHYEKT